MTRPATSSDYEWLPDRRGRWMRFVAMAALMAAAWLGVLPRLARVPEVRDRIDSHTARGIDPSAKFYTELPLMPGLLERIDRQRTGR